MSMCRYKYKDGTYCKNIPFYTFYSYKCILHIDFSNNHQNDFILEKEKQKEIQRKLNSRESNFEGTIIKELNLYTLEIDFELNFRNSFIIRGINIVNSTINNLILSGSLIEGSVNIISVSIPNGIHFENHKKRQTILKKQILIQNNNKSIGTIDFSNAKLDGGFDFKNLKLGYLNLRNSNIQSCVFLSNVETTDIYLIRSNIKDYVYIGNCNIKHDINFYYAQIGGDLTIKNSKIGNMIRWHEKNIYGQFILENTSFKHNTAKEQAHRKARRIYENYGDFKKADDHFYHEMVSISGQKNWMGKVIYFIPHYILCYGVKLHRLFISWLLIVLIFSLIIYFFNGIESNKSFQENITFGQSIYFSIITLTNFGYGDFSPRTEIFQFASSLLAVFGTLFWGAFIVLFMHKIMRK
jgi:uncharacterized protein YjbI with pentapeptide repeats